MRISLGNVDRLTQLVQLVKQQFPYVVFLPIFYANANRGGFDLFSPEGIRAYNPDRRFQAPVFQAAYGTAGYDEAAIIAAFETILAGGMPAGATATGPAAVTTSGGGGGGVTDLFPDLVSGGGSMFAKVALPIGALAAMFLFFKWR